MTSVQGVQANKMPFFSENVPQKNIPMPLMSRIDPAIWYVSSYTNGNAYFKKQKLSLLIFTCSKLTIKIPEQDAKSFKSQHKENKSI